MAAAPCVVASALLLAACGASDARPAPTVTTSTFTISGRVEISGSSDEVYHLPVLSPGQQRVCGGGAFRYTDIDTGTSVTITNAADRVLGHGVLHAGTIPAHGIAGVNACSFAFSVPGVPLGERSYVVVVAHRPGVEYSAADAHQPVRVPLS